jgi:hypothetical protein
VKNDELVADVMLGALAALISVLGRGSLAR